MNNLQTVVLVVDDEPLVLSGTAKLLKQAGYSILEAENGKQALWLAQKHIPDLILLDSVLPDIDGLAVCRQLKTDKNTAGIFISIVSGKRITSSDQSDGLELGADEYIIRPIANRELLARVKAMLRIIHAEKGLQEHQLQLEALIENRTADLKQEIEERKQAEEAIREKELIFNLFMENSPIYMFFKDENIRSLYLSSNYEKMLGMPIEKLLGKSMDDLFPSELAKKMIADDQTILKNGKVVKVKEKLNDRFYETIKFPIFIHGKPKYLAGFTIDITERIHSEEQKNRLVMNLQHALSEIKTLHGLLPICSFCKRIRDDQGYWNQLEKYIHEHSEATFSHSICRDCAKKHYPDFDIYED